MPGTVLGCVWWGGGATVHQRSLEPATEGGGNRLSDLFAHHLTAYWGRNQGALGHKYIPGRVDTDKQYFLYK